MLTYFSVTQEPTIFRLQMYTFIYYLQNKSQSFFGLKQKKQFAMHWLRVEGYPKRNTYVRLAKTQHWHTQGGPHTLQGFLWFLWLFFNLVEKAITSIVCALRGKENSKNNKDSKNNIFLGNYIELDPC